MPQLTVQQLFDAKRSKLQLEWITNKDGGARILSGDMLKRSGVGVIGHLNPIHSHRIKVLGTTEIEYLNRLDPAGLKSTLEYLFSPEGTSAVFITQGLPVSDAMRTCAENTMTPLFSSPETSQELINVLRQYLYRTLAETTTLHGVFLDVLGVGVLVTGDSSIGKSELALELISRGSGLVADDIVELSQISPDTLQGRCPPLLKDFLEVRGIGVLNIRSIFGETAVRAKKNLKIIVHLEKPGPGDAAKLDRLQTNATTRTILGVATPMVTLGVVAGRNLAVLVEAAVRNYILQLRGIDSTRQFIERHEQLMADDQNISEEGS
ncbi:MAG: HPr(Ser) kinase/phosphatase [Burkholderiales bacterium]